MYFKTKTRSRKQIDKVKKCGRWHKFFVIWPREIKTSQGQSEFAFFTFVYRKAKISYSNGGYAGGSSGYEFYYRYRKPEDSTLEALIDGDELEFTDPGSRDTYQRMLKECEDE